MKSYTITVNGVAYNVTVEENAQGSAPAARAAAPAPAAPAPAAPAPAPAAPAASQGAGSVKVSASVPGKVLSIAVSAGQEVKSGDTIVMLESMKMEIPVVAPQDGTIASIEVAAGAAVENGDVLATMN